MMVPITATKKNKNVLSELVAELGSNLILYNIIEETPNGIFIVNPDHKIVYGNPSVSSFLGYKLEELRGRSLPGALSIDRNSTLIKEHELFVSGQLFNGCFRQEIILKHHKTGAERSVELVFNRPKKESGFYTVLLIDIDERKRLEIKLRQRNNFFHNLINSSVDSIISSNMDGNIILFNQGAQQLLGYSEQEAIESLHVTSLYPEGSAYEIIQQMRSDEYGGKGKLLRHELMVVTKSGNQIPVSFSGGIIYDNNKEVATFGIFTDLRLIQKIEEDLEQTHKMLEQSEKMAGLGRLAAGVAHEINNPMSGIMLYSNLAKEELGEDHPLSWDMDTIIREAERCKVIVSDLLEFSHQTSYDMGNVDLNDTIVKALAILEMQPLFQNIDIQLNLDDGIRGISGNSIKLNQVFMNIIVNSAQAMEGNGILKIISQLRSHGDIAEITISDTGPGIKEEDQLKIFEPFFTTKVQGEGTGLGLSVSYAIIKEHKGTIRVSSTSDGASFKLKFPVQKIPVLGESS